MKLQILLIAFVTASGCVSSGRYHQAQERQATLATKLQACQSHVDELRKENKTLSLAAKGQLVAEYRVLQEKCSSLEKTLKVQAKKLREKDAEIQRAASLRQDYQKVSQEHAALQKLLGLYLRQNSLNEVAASRLKNDGWEIAEVLGTVTVKDDFDMDNDYVVIQVEFRKKIFEEWDWRTKTDRAKRFWARDGYGSIDVLDNSGNEDTMREASFLDYELEERVRNRF